MDGAGAPSPAHQITQAILTEMYHYFLSPATPFDPAYVGPFSVTKHSFVQALEACVLRASGVRSPSSFDDCMCYDNTTCRDAGGRARARRWQTR